MEPPPLTRQQTQAFEIRANGMSGYNESEAMMIDEWYDSANEYEREDMSDSDSEEGEDDTETLIEGYNGIWQDRLDAEGNPFAYVNRVVYQFGTDGDPSDSDDEEYYMQESFKVYEWQEFDMEDDCTVV